MHRGRHGRVIHALDEIQIVRCAIHNLRCNINLCAERRSSGDFTKRSTGFSTLEAWHTAQVGSRILLEATSAWHQRIYTSVISCNASAIR